MAEEEPVETPATEAPTSGSGKFIYPDGSTYEGGWQTFDGVVKKHGSGKYVSGDNSYEGEWKEDMMDGKGEFKFASGACYSGTWVKNQFMGEGTYTWPDKTTYAGGWADNKMHGKGTYVDSKAETWEGDFYNGNGPELLNVQ